MTVRCHQKPMICCVLRRVALLMIFFGTAIRAQNDCMLAEARVAVSVSPVAVRNPDGGPDTRYMEIFWFGMNLSLADDWIGIWSMDPLEDTSAVLDSAPFSGEVDGHWAFSVEFNASIIPVDVSSIEGGSCLPYWVGYVQEGRVIHSACLKIQPHWMQNMKSLLEEVSLCEVLLPGTHDAGAANDYKNWSADGLIGNTVSQWTITQEEGLWGQLVMGVRYLDMRIAYYPNKEYVYYVNHGEVTVAPLYIYLEDVARFMTQTEEIMIFDIHSLVNDFGSNIEAVSGLVTLFESYLSTWMVPNSFIPISTMGSLWLANRRLILTYPGRAPNEFFWESVEHLWGDVNDLDELIHYFDTNIPLQAGSLKLWSTMAQFTPTALDVTLNRWGGLDGAANITNLPVSGRLARDWWRQANIMAMDFVLGSDIVDVIIQANALKFSCLR